MEEMDSSGVLAEGAGVYFRVHQKTVLESLQGSLIEGTRALQFIRSSSNDTTNRGCICSGICSSSCSAVH